MCDSIVCRIFFGVPVTQIFPVSLLCVLDGSKFHIYQFRFIFEYYFTGLQNACTCVCVLVKRTVSGRGGRMHSSTTKPTKTGEWLQLWPGHNPVHVCTVFTSTNAHIGSLIVRAHVIDTKTSRAAAVPDWRTLINNLAPQSPPLAGLGRIWRVPRPCVPRCSLCPVLDNMYARVQ
jgi:hypothetical protein